MIGIETTQNHLKQGTCFIKGKTLNVLYDPGVTHSFISSDFAKHLELLFSFLDASLVVSTPTSESMTTKSLFKLCRVHLK